MKVAKDLVVSLAYQVRTEDGVLVDESPVSAPLDYLHGHGSLISGLETALDGHEVGDKFDVAVGANDAYGQYDENLVQRVPKDVFMGVDELQVGMRFLAETDQGPVPEIQRRSCCYPRSDRRRTGSRPRSRCARSRPRS